MANNLIVCGGTFDHFHKGHESFLRYVFSVGNKYIVGIMSDQYIKKSNIKNQISKIESFEARKNEVLEFLKNRNILDKVRVVEINDLFGQTLDKSLEIDAIVVSQETKEGAEIINARRKKLGLKDLNILVAPSVKASDGKLISSARIRNGAINRSGKLYVNPLWFKKNLILPENLREELKKPFGKIFKENKPAIKKDALIITVGDVTTKTFNEKSLGQNISVIDFKVNREKKFTNIEELGFDGDEKIFYADNPAGYISSNLFKKLSKIFQLGARDKIVLQVNGEEDLVVLPLILTAPLSTVLYYGQPPQRSGSEGQAGLVEVLVSEKNKERAYDLVSKFRPM